MYILRKISFNIWCSFNVDHLGDDQQKVLVHSPTTLRDKNSNKVSNIIQTNSEHKSFPLSDVPLCKAFKHDLKSCINLNCGMTSRHVSGSTLAITAYKTLHSPVPPRTTQRSKVSTVTFSISHAWGQLCETAFYSHLLGQQHCNVSVVWST